VKRAWTFLLTTAVVANVVKGFPHSVQEMGFPYWTMTYDDGFIRRGLVGTLIHEFFVGFHPNDQRNIVLALHVTVYFAWIALLYLWARFVTASSDERTRACVLGGLAALLLSHFPTTVFLLCGYLDVILVALCVACAFSVERGKYKTAGVLAAIGPVVHDAFLFLWAPIALLELRELLRTPAAERRARLRTIAPLASALVAAALTMAFHSPSAAERMVAKAPVPPEIQDSFYKFQFGLHIRDALGLMWEKYTLQLDQFLLACAFFLPPILVTAACAYVLDRDTVRWRRILFTIAMLVAPTVVLAIAWDLSRFLLWSGMGAFLLLIRNARDPRKATAFDRRPLVAALAACVFFSTGPYVYAYFEAAFAEYSFAPSATRSTPAAFVTYRFLRIYNRKQFLRDFSSDEKGTCATVSLGGEKVAPCSFVLRPTNWAETKPLWFGPATYEVTITTSPTDLPCPSPTPPVASLTNYVYWRSGGLKPGIPVPISETGVTKARFTMTEEETGMARASVRIVGTEGCFRLDGIRVVLVEE